MRTINEFTQRSHLPAALIRAVVRQSGGWESFQEDAPGIAYAVNGGFHGWTYYNETIAFAKKHKKVILSHAAELARDIGEGDEYQLIAGFNCLSTRGRPDYAPGQIASLIHGSEPRDDDRRADYTQVMNALSWFAAEEVSRAWCDYLEYLND